MSRIFSPQTLTLSAVAGLLFLVSVVGAWLVRREGLGILRKAQEEMAQGRVPGRQLVDGLLVLFGGALMLTPGFATDALGLSLLFPPTRALLRAVASRWFGRRMANGQPTMTWRFHPGGVADEGKRAAASHTGALASDAEHAGERERGTHRPQDHPCIISQSG